MEKVYNISVLEQGKGMPDKKDIKIKKRELLANLLNYLVKNKATLTLQTHLAPEIDSQFASINAGIWEIIQNMVGAECAPVPFGIFPLKASGVINEKWAIIIIDEAKQDGTFGRFWHFAFRNASSCSDYNFVSVPDIFEIHDGSLIGYGYYFPAFEPPWPWPVLNPHKYSGICLDRRT